MIKIISDSTSYLKKEEAQEMDVKILPVIYKSGNYIYLENFSGQEENLDDLIRNADRYITSHPDEDSFIRSFQEEIDKGNKVLCITLSSRLSRAYYAAKKAASFFDKKDVAVFDSLGTAGKNYLLIRTAKTLINKNLSLEEIVSKLEETRDKIKTYFSINDMQSLRRSGRIGFVRMSVGNIMNKTPILALKEGTVVFEDMARGQTHVVKMLTESINKNTEAVVINYIENTSTAIAVHNVLKSRYPDLLIKLRKAGPILGIHLGFGFVGVSSLEK